METATDPVGHAAAFLRARKQQEAIVLPKLLGLIVNNKEHGLVHRLSEATRSAPRELRRAKCGWRAGGAVAKARFCYTSVWPPLGAATHRLCSKCFPKENIALLWRHNER